MGKFKIGDRVRRTGYSLWPAHYGEVGSVYTVLDADAFGITVVEGKGQASENDFELVTPTITITYGKHYRCRNGKATGRISEGDIGFEATVDGSVRVFDKAGGHVFGDGDFDIVEAWTPKVGERVRFTQDNPNGGRMFGSAGYVAYVTDGSRIGGQVTIQHPGHSFNPHAPISALEPLPVAAPLRIVAGKFYKTRDGRKVGPMLERVGYLTVEGYHYNESGMCCYLGQIGETPLPDRDLIAEWVDEPAAPVVATASNDNAAPAAAKFKVGDRVKTDGVYSFDPNLGEIVSIEDGYINVKIDNDGYGGGLWAYGEEDLSVTVAPQQSTTGFTIPLVDEDDDLKPLTVVISADTADAESALDTIIAKLERIAELQEQLGLRAA